MAEQVLLIREEAQCIYLTLNRPQVHNAFNEQLIQALIAVLEKIQTRNDLRVCILQSSGTSFSAGADLQWMQRSIDYTETENQRDAQQLALLLQLLQQCPIPTVAIAQGNAFGGGVGLLAACDIVIAAERAQFCFSETKLGLIPAVISPYVINAIGYRQAMRWFLTAEMLTATTAKEINLVHEVVPETALQETAQQLIQQLLRNGPLAVRACKQLIHANRNITDAKQLHEYTINAVASIRVSTEGQEGLRAFFDKRKPNW
jgi:methylglutaconyl-CoA hydratase